MVLFTDRSGVNVSTPTFFGADLLWRKSRFWAVTGCDSLRGLFHTQGSSVQEAFPLSARVPMKLSTLKRRQTTCLQDPASLKEEWEKRKHESLQNIFTVIKLHFTENILYSLLLKL